MLDFKRKITDRDLSVVIRVEEGLLKLYRDAISLNPFSAPRRALGKLGCPKLCMKDQQDLEH